MEKYNLYQSLLDDQKRLVQLVGLKLENGLDNQMPLNSVQEDLAEMEKSVAMIEKEVSLKKHALQKIMGRAVDENFFVKPCWRYEAEPGKIPEFIGSDLLARRPDIMAKIWQVRSAAKLVGVAKAEFLPNINLNGAGGFFSFQFNKMFTNQSLLGYLLPSFQLPVFTAGKLKANLKAQIASYEQRIQEYNDLILSAIQQVADQITIYQCICVKLKDQALKEELLYQDMKLVGLRVENGLDPLMNYLIARNRYLQEQAVLVDLQVEYYVASVELIKALGGGYLTDENPSLCRNTSG
jgi:outer membrane protein TolC